MTQPPDQKPALPPKKPRKRRARTAASKTARRKAQDGLALFQMRHAALADIKDPIPPPAHNKLERARPGSPAESDKARNRKAGSPENQSTRDRLNAKAKRTALFLIGYPAHEDMAPGPVAYLVRRLNALGGVALLADLEREAAEIPGALSVRSTLARYRAARRYVRAVEFAAPHAAQETIARGRNPYLRPAQALSVGPRGRDCCPVCGRQG